MLNIIEINNFNAPELDVYARYTEAQLLNKDLSLIHIYCGSTWKYSRQCD